MALITKPDMEFIWASGGAIVEPSDVKKQTGWTPEVPPHQWENWVQNRQDQYLAHINQRGIPAWDGLTNYEAGGLSYVQGSDGKVYKSVAASGPASVVSDPTTDATDTYWTIAFADVGAFLTQTVGDARYTQRSNNLSDLTNVSTARTNLGLATGAVTVVGTIATQNSNGVNITGGSVTGITDLSVADGGTGASDAAAARTNLGAAPVVSPAFTGTPVAPTAPVGTNTTQVATTAFVLSAAIGYGQTWQDVTGSRVTGTTYTNTTGRPIQIFVTFDPVGGGPHFLIDGVNILSDSDTSYYNVACVVPAGSTYRLIGNGGAVSMKWTELR